MVRYELISRLLQSKSVSIGKVQQVKCDAKLNVIKQKNCQGFIIQKYSIKKVPHMCVKHLFMLHLQFFLMKGMRCTIYD
jgi:hypothetical protein